MTLVLSTIPGFSDLSNTALAANKFALGTHLNRINFNANFGLVRLEIFVGLYKNGDVVPLPVSSIDNYQYTRSECIYMWVPQNTADPTSGWASFREPWTMWYGIWNVNQANGQVLSEIGYRGNDDHKDRQASTNDGVLQVFTIAQRQKTNLVLSAVPTYAKKVTTDFTVNEALHTGMMTVLNADAKFSVVNTEVMYMGEFTNGQTVPQPVSPADGRTYAYSECMFQTSMRWTADTDGNGNPIKPAINKGQLQDWSSSVTTSGAVRIANQSVTYELSGQHTFNTGKVAVFAFCSRPVGTTFTPAQNLFSELVDSVFAPGATLRASTMQQLNNNINQAVCTPEFFGPTNYSNGNNIALPTSPLDGYTYARSELAYVWDWANTGPSANTTGRLSLVHGNIDASGNVTINDYRLNSGASSVSLVHEGTMRVLVIGMRSRTLASPPITNPGAPAFGSDDVIEFYGPNDRQTQYLSKNDGTVTQSLMLTPQASMQPNQTVTLTFSMPAPGTLLLVTWLAQSLLRIDATTFNLLSSQGANLVVNGGGEAGTLGSAEPNWTLILGNALITANDFVIGGGTKSMKITEAAGGNNGSAQNVSLVGGKVYVIEGVVKNTALTGGAGFGALINCSIVSGITSFTILTKFSAYDAGLTTTPTVGLAADNVAHLQFVQCYFIPAANGVMQILLQLAATNAGSAWFDDVACYEFLGGVYPSLSNSSAYYIYEYIDTVTQLVAFTNGNPPPTSPSDTFSQQCQFDKRIGLPPKKIITPGAGSSGSDSGGGDGTCSEFTEPVTIRRYSDEGELIFEGVVPSGEVTTGFESDDGTERRGCHIKGWSFKKNQFVFRAVHRTRLVHCAGWMIVDGHRLTPCEAVWHDSQWKPAWKVPGAIHDSLVSMKMDIEVEADWDDEHNYLVGETIIHNTFVLPC